MEHTMNATLGKNKGVTVVKVVGCSCGGSRCLMCRLNVSYSSTFVKELQINFDSGYIYIYITRFLIEWLF